MVQQSIGPVNIFRNFKFKTQKMTDSYDMTEQCLNNSWLSVKRNQYKKALWIYSSSNSFGPILTSLKNVKSLSIFIEVDFIQSVNHHLSSYLQSRNSLSYLL